MSLVTSASCKGVIVVAKLANLAVNNFDAKKSVSCKWDLVCVSNLCDFGKKCFRFLNFNLSSVFGRHHVDCQTRKLTECQRNVKSIGACRGKVQSGRLTKNNTCSPEWGRELPHNLMPEAKLAKRNMRPWVVLGLASHPCNSDVAYPCIT